MWCYLYRICLCTSITVSDIVTCVSPVIFGASQPVSVVSRSSLHVMLVLGYEFVPWSPCLPRSTESMPIVLSETSLPCCAFFIPLFLTTGHKSTRSSCLGGNGGWGSPGCSSLPPHTLWHGLFPQWPAQVLPLHWQRGPISIFYFFSWEPMAILSSESNKGFYLMWSLLFCDSSEGAHSEKQMFWGLVLFSYHCAQSSCVVSHSAPHNGHLKI